MENITKRMEAQLLLDGSVNFIAPQVGFDLLVTFLGEALWELRNEKDRFRALVGIRFEEAEALKDELLLIRYGPLGVARPILHNGELWGPTMVRRTGTTWDKLPRMEVELFPDGRVALTLARGELDVFANAMGVTLAYQAPNRTPSERDELNSRHGVSVEEIQAFIIGLEKMGRELF